jgi:glutaredoxin
MYNKNNRSDNMNEEKKNNNKVLIIVLSIIGTILVLGFIGIYILLLSWDSIQTSINNQWNEITEEVNNNQQWDNVTTNNNKDNVDKISSNAKLDKTIDGKAIIYFFRGEGCSHCAEAEAWFESIKEEYGKYFIIKDYETWYNQENAELMKKVAKARGEEANGVPYIIIGDKSWMGFTQSYTDEMLKEIGKVSTISE